MVLNENSFSKLVLKINAEIISETDYNSLPLHNVARYSIALLQLFNTRIRLTYAVAVVGDDITDGL